MKIEVRLAIMSHLSDAQYLLSNPEKARLEINFVKYLLSKYKDNINQEVDEQELDLDWCICRTKFGSE